VQTLINFKVQSGIVLLYSETPFFPLALRPIFLLDPVYFFFYSLPLKKEILIKHRFPDTWWVASAAGFSGDIGPVKKETGGIHGTPKGGGN
jgi:hypothetical protein